MTAEQPCLVGDGDFLTLLRDQVARWAAVMRELYDGDVDTAYFSCDLGVVKPDPEFFRRILADLGAAPDEVFFVDDTPANVEGGRTAGLHAMHWRHEQGLDRLRSGVAALGLPV